ncbi:hypothetical protein HYDPIDRAFT_108037 [Hydnomerulius pinastri MD-312]|nr:hypothetical protein HYDPIDRAFT_108037 [Hydnomerulius pinastri MD-312]
MSRCHGNRDLGKIMMCQSRQRANPVKVSPAKHDIPQSNRLPLLLPRNHQQPIVFPRLSTIATAAFAVLAVATPHVARQTSQCDTGPLQY